LSKKLLRNIFFKIPFQSRKETSENIPFYASELNQLLGYVPTDYYWYERAFTHPSFNRKDKNGRSYNYDRLEFLGDSVLSAVVSEIIFNTFEDASEGELSELRAKIVSRKNLNEIGRKLGLRKYFRNASRNTLGDNLEGNALEALVGAIYKDKGYDQARQFIKKRIMRPYVDLFKMKNKISSYKNEMVEWAQKNKKSIRFEHQLETDRKNHDIHFISLYIDGKLMGRGRASSKKKAEEIAAKNAYNAISK
jgi:ribonuclease-3